MILSIVHGCILRIERPGETRTYLVDPQFPKRADARSAVCLLAMSQDVGGYIRGLKEEAENKLSAERRKLANEKLIQTLSYECSKVKLGNRLMFTFSTERDGGSSCLLLRTWCMTYQHYSIRLHFEGRYILGRVRCTGVHREHGIPE